LPANFKSTGEDPPNDSLSEPSISLSPFTSSILSLIGSGFLSSKDSLFCLGVVTILLTLVLSVSCFNLGRNLGSVDFTYICACDK